MSDLEQTNPARPGARLGGLLARRVMWLTDQRRDAAGETSDAAALVVVLGREHYVERRRTYPIASRRDLAAVLRQELAGAPPTLTLAGPLRDDRREVALYEVQPDVVARIGRTVWVVPESVALAATLAPGEVAAVERHGYRYFLAATGLSQPAGGALGTVELFAVAAGLDPGAPVQFGGSGLRERLLDGLRRLPLDAWPQLRMVVRRARLAVNWKPVATALGVALVGYLALASGYLLLTRQAREAELASLGGEVENLLKVQREVDLMLAEQQGLAKVMAGRRDTYRLWQVVAAAWGKGAELAVVELRDQELVLRGSAAVATDVLAAVGSLPGVEGARFSSPVRTAREGREEFAISLKFTAVAKRD